MMFFVLIVSILYVLLPSDAWTQCNGMLYTPSLQQLDNFRDIEFICEGIDKDADLAYFDNNNTTAVTSMLGSCLQLDFMYYLIRVWSPSQTAVLNTSASMSVRVLDADVRAAIHPSTTVLYALCQMSPPATSPVSITTADNTEKWTKLGMNEVCLSAGRMNHSEAEQYCNTTHGASLAYFTDIFQYFHLIHALQLAPDVYWVDDPILTDPVFCLSLDVNTTSLSKSECKLRFYAICLRFTFAGNISEVVKVPGFTQMLDEMTVEKEETLASIRQQSCAQDKRTSSVVSGALAIFLLSSVTGVFLLADFTRVLAWLVGKLVNK